MLIKYNGLLLDPKWYSDVVINYYDNYLEIKLLNSFFNPKNMHKLALAVVNKSGNLIESFQFQKPICPIDTVMPIVDWSGFGVSPKIKNHFYNLTFQEKINPALIASLVAQESSFNPKAFSWSKAVGLTQITNIAATEIQDIIPKWVNDKRLQSLDYSQSKFYINTGVITAQDDWRLDSKLSLLGGIYYLRHLDKYWSKPRHERLLATLENSNAKNEVILASYNSGAARVKAQIKKYGKNWLASKNLNEGRNYVQSILSYCHDFTDNTRKNL
jgi:hypothetical protein